MLKLYNEIIKFDIRYYKNKISNNINIGYYSLKRHKIELFMINITLPDGKKIKFDFKPTGMDIAKNIGEGLAKAALAIRVNGELQDLCIEVTEDALVEIITANSDDGLEVLRHDTAHILAQAVKELFPETQITIGPVIENGFYYDFARDEPFTINDLEVIEKKMAEIVKRNDPIVREVWDREEAIDFFKSQGELYKAEIITDIAQDQQITLYRQGEFIDLCRGPHAPSTGMKKAFKLMKLAGAYWRGDSKNQMLQRIYGTVWQDEKKLKEYLTMLEEAEKRDHRKLGKSLKLFHLQDEAVGQVFWHPNGWTIYRLLENYIRNKIYKDGYIEVKTPILASRSLWESSGHWEKFRSNMFTAESEEKIFALKPMNCPLHVQIFNQELKSYRDLPLRMAEFGCCHRNESSGSMHGLMRVRGFTQDDAHIFCEENDITNETIKFTNLLKEIYNDFGFHKIKVKFSDRPEMRAGTDQIWDKAEQSLKEAVEATGLEYTINPGEGAFYGPKLEFVLTDAIGRDWQCGTLQVDFVLPERLGAQYVGRDGNKHIPVMLHRAILGSFERFIGIIIEQYAGKFPLWLAPTQIVVASITSDVENYAKTVYNRFKDSGLRAMLDVSADKITYKIREHSLNKVPYIVIIGKNEAENDSVSVRAFGTNEQYNMGLEEFIEKINNEISNISVNKVE